MYFWRNSKRRFFSVELTTWLLLEVMFWQVVSQITGLVKKPQDLTIDKENPAKAFNYNWTVAADSTI